MITKRGKRISIGAITALLISFPSPLACAANGMLGELQPHQFKKATADSGCQVEALQPGSEPLSWDDVKLLRETALGCIRQMELSKVAAAMATSEDVKMIAVGEIEEQTSITAKITEIAVTGGTTLPTLPDDETASQVEELKRQSGIALDQMYIEKCGVTGHEQCLAAMENIRNGARNPALRALAIATLPLIHTHLRLARIELSEMK